MTTATTKETPTANKWVRAVALVDAEEAYVQYVSSSRVLALMDERELRLAAHSDPVLCELLTAYDIAAAEL